MVRSAGRGRSHPRRRDGNKRTRVRYHQESTATSTAATTGDDEDDDDDSAVDEVFCLSSIKVTSSSSTSSVVLHEEEEEDSLDNSIAKSAPHLSRAAEWWVGQLHERWAEGRENLWDLWAFSTRSQRFLAILALVLVLFTLVCVILVYHSALASQNKSARGGAGSQHKHIRTSFPGDKALKSMADLALGGASLAPSSSPHPLEPSSTAPSFNNFFLTIPLTTNEPSRAPRTDRPSTRPSSTQPSSGPSRVPSPAPVVAALFPTVTIAVPTTLTTGTSPLVPLDLDDEGVSTTSSTTTTTIRMNAGVDISFVDAFGQRWLSDRSFHPVGANNATNNNKSNSKSNSNSVSDRVDRSDVCRRDSNTTITIIGDGMLTDDGLTDRIDPRLFCHCARATGTYTFVVVPHEIYRIDLYLVVSSSAPSNGTTKVLFDLRAENMLVHRQWQGPADPSSSSSSAAAAASYANAYHETDVHQLVSFHVYVSDRQLDLTFGNGAALLAGIVVTQQKTTEELLQVTIQSDLSYVPGLLTTSTEPSTTTTGLILSAGLSARVLARSGTPVLYDNDGYGGGTSDLLFHRRPDAGATFPTADGGWIYVSNSQAAPEPAPGDDDPLPGGVGALTFDRNGNIVRYQMVLNGTRANGGRGARTPWGTWISGAEEYAAAPDSRGGRLWQVDPTGQRSAERLTMGDVYPGLFESFAYDIRHVDAPHFFVTTQQEHSVKCRSW
jgi:hypothetical protein